MPLSLRRDALEDETTTLSREIARIKNQLLAHKQGLLPAHLYPQLHAKEERLRQLQNERRLKQIADAEES